MPSRSVMKEWIENKKQYFKENTNGKFMVLGYSQTIRSKSIETICGQIWQVLVSTWPVYFQNWLSSVEQSSSTSVQKLKKKLG